MTKWEYLFLEMSDNGAQLLPDSYGEKGWELVAVVKASDSIDRMWFKRPKSVARPPATPPKPVGSSE